MLQFFLNPMNKCIESLDLQNLKEFCEKLENEGQRKEQIRACVERYLTTRALLIGPSFPISEVDDFLQFVIVIAKEGLCGVSFTVQILQDMFDVSLTKRCEELFTIVEKSIAIFKTDFFFNPCKNLILRMCNDLLKRLSRTVNTAFCGRIIVLLAKSLPLNERSGLNLPGHFNTSNVTVFERDDNKMDEDQEKPLDNEDDDRDEGELREIDSNVVMNHALYVKFWEIQAYFANPFLLNDVNVFNKFESNLWDVLTVFSTYKLERIGSSKTERSDNSTTLVNGVAEPKDLTEQLDQNLINEGNSFALKDLDLGDDFFAKYLTSPKLFNLQLADLQFRRYFLVQCLILMNWLNTKPRTKDNFGAIQDSFLKEVTDKCFAALKETHPHGSHFAESIRRILQREKSWIGWKSEGCVDIVESRTGCQCLAYKKRPINRFNPNVIDLSNQELTRLWNINPNNLAACTEPERNCMPELKKFVEACLDEMDPDQQVEEQYRSVNNENYQWMASRFLLYNSDHYLSCSSLEIKASSKPTSKFLEQAIHITAVNMPELKERAESIQERIQVSEAEREAEIIRQAEAEREAAEQKAEKDRQAVAEKLAAVERAKKLEEEEQRKKEEELQLQKEQQQKEQQKQRKEKRAMELERMKKEEQEMKARLEQKVQRKTIKKELDTSTDTIEKTNLSEKTEKASKGKEINEKIVIKKEKDAASVISRRNTTDLLTSAVNAAEKKNGSATSLRNSSAHHANSTSASTSGNGAHKEHKEKNNCGSNGNNNVETMPPEPVTPGTPSSTASLDRKDYTTTPSSATNTSAKKRKADKLDKLEKEKSAKGDTERTSRHIKVEHHHRHSYENDDDASSPPHQKSARRSGLSRRNN